MGLISLSILAIVKSGNKIMIKRVLVLFSCLIFIFSCSTIIAKERSNNSVIWQENENIFVKFTARDGDKKINNAHPVEINPADIHAMLSALQVEKKKNKRVPLFSEQQQTILSEKIAKGLKTGRADQDIIFALQREERSLAGLKTDHYFIAGRVFYANDHLNLIIGDYERPRNRAYEMAYDPTNQGLVKYSFNVGTRESDGQLFDERLVFNASNISFESNTNRSDWLKIDMSDVDYYVEATPEEAPAQYSAPAVTTEAQTTRQSYAAPQKSEVSTPSSIDSSIINRFKTLEALKKDGLITEEEYQRKRKALLDEL
jgi:hypothetical protein